MHLAVWRNIIAIVFLTSNLPANVWLDIGKLLEDRGELTKQCSLSTSNADAGSVVIQEVHLASSTQHEMPRKQVSPDSIRGIPNDKPG